MPSTYVPIVFILVVLAAGLLSRWLALSVAIVEIVLGVIAGNMLGIQATGWMVFLAGFGGTLLIFLAGLEIEPRFLRAKLKESLLIGAVSFAVPFAVVFACCRWVAHWSVQASEIGGAALSTAAVGVIYVTLAQSGLLGTETGKIVLAATFVTNVLALSVVTVLFAQAGWLSLLYVLGSVSLIALAPRLFARCAPWMRGAFLQLDVKIVFAFLFAFMLLAQLGRGYAVLPVFVFGFVLSPVFATHPDLRGNLTAIGFGFITPFFFVCAGMSVSTKAVVESMGLFALLFLVGLVGKGSVCPLGRRYLPGHGAFSLMLMSTGVTLGAVVALFGLEAGYIDGRQYSVLVAVAITGAVIPSLTAQKWLRPAGPPDAATVLPTRSWRSSPHPGRRLPESED